MGMSILYPLWRIGISYPRQQPRTFFVNIGFFSFLICMRPFASSKNWMDPLRCWTCLQLFPKVPWAPFLWKAWGLDFENDVSYKTLQKLDGSP